MKRPSGSSGLRWRASGWAFSAISLEEDPERSILLAMHAVKATRCADRMVIPEAEDALHRAITALCPFQLRY